MYGDTKYNWLASGSTSASADDTATTFQLDVNSRLQIIGIKTAGS